MEVMKKKIFVAGMALVLAVGMLSGCGKSQGAAEKTTENAAAVKVDYSKGLKEDGTLKDNDGSYVKLCDYDAIKIDKNEVAVTEEEVQTQIDSLMQGYQTTEQIKDRKVKKGDTVNIDYVGTVDGKEFDGGSADGYDLTIGSGTFIEGFEDQLIGHKPGEKVEVKVTFPEDYPTEDLANKAAVFATMINYIAKTVTPELNDQFVKEKLQDSYGYTSVKNMKKQIRQGLEDNKKYNYIWTYMMDKCTFAEIPEELVNVQLDVMLDGLKANLQAQGATMEQYLKSSGYEDENALKEAYYTDCEEMVKTYLIADAVAAEKKLTASDDAVKEYFKKFYKTEDYSSYVDYYSRPYINRTVLNNMVTESLAETAKVK